MKSTSTQTEKIFEQLCSERMALGKAPTLIPRIKICAGKYRGMDGTVMVKRKAERHHGGNAQTDTWRNEATGEILGYTLREAEELCSLRHLRNQEIAGNKAAAIAIATEAAEQANEEAECVFILSTEPDCCYQCGRSRASH